MTCVDDINDFDLITDADWMKILQLMDEANEKRKANASSKPKKYPKLKPIPQKASKSRLAKLKTSNIPAMNVLYTNADQLTTGKMTELKHGIENKL